MGCDEELLLMTQRPMERIKLHLQQSGLPAKLLPIGCVNRGPYGEDLLWQCSYEQ